DYLAHIRKPAASDRFDCPFGHRCRFGVFAQVELCQRKPGAALSLLIFLVTCFHELERFLQIALRSRQVGNFLVRLKTLIARPASPNPWNGVKLMTGLNGFAEGVGSEIPFGLLLANPGQVFVSV